jgi:hypothetical protein
VNLRRPLIALVYSLPLLIVAFGVLMGGYALSQATDDTVGAALSWRVATVCLMLLVGNIVLLVGVLGVYVLGRADQTDDDSSARRDSSS